ncbi:MAG: hypothetical protein ACM3U2_10900 [Deltaproteobacteria bacterium]
MSFSRWYSSEMTSFSFFLSIALISCGVRGAAGADKPKPKQGAAEAAAKQSAQDKFTVSTLAEPDRELLDKLRKRVDVEWSDTPLPEALATLAAETEVKLTIDEDDLKKVGVDAPPKVSGKWKERPAEDILGEVLSSPKMDYILNGGNLVVVSRRRAMITPVSLTYDVKKICRDKAALEQLKREIYKIGGEDEWDTTGGFASITADPAQRTLTINHTWSRHAAIRNAMRTSGAKKR